MKELSFVEPELKTFGTILKIRDFLIIKETPHIILDVLDDITGDTFVCCNKADIKQNKSQTIFKLKLEDKDNYTVMVNKADATLAVFYQDFMTMHKIIGGKSEALTTI